MKSPGSPRSPLESHLQKLRKSSACLRNISSEQKNLFLRRLGDLLQDQSKRILMANAKDLSQLSPQVGTAFRDRLTLNQKRLQGMQDSLLKIADLPDPIGEMVETRFLPNGLHLKRIRAPLGVLLMIFEARPNVITEALALSFKSGNSLCLRGGSESRQTSHCIYQLISKAFKDIKIPFPPFYAIEDYDRMLVRKLLKRSDIFDVVIPRGGEKLIHLVQELATMPIIKNDRGLCHAYVDEFADLDMAIKIIVNAKTQRPGVCNSLETILIHQKIAPQILPLLFQEMKRDQVQWYCDLKSYQLLNGSSLILKAKKASWDTEYLALKLNCRIVKNMDEAIAHIEKHSSRHSETIITSEKERAQDFQSRVDSAAVYWNASTRFTDGYEFGLGGEIGISTQKLHVRGPVGLRELTSARWIIDGNGQIRS